MPLIAAAVGGLKDFLVDGKNALLFKDNDPASLLEAYKKIELLRDDLIAEGTVTAQEYNWQSIASRLTDIYREMKS